MSPLIVQLGDGLGEPLPHALHLLLPQRLRLLQPDGQLAAPGSFPDGRLQLVHAQPQLVPQVIDSRH